MDEEEKVQFRMLQMHLDEAERIASNFNTHFLALSFNDEVPEDVRFDAGDKAIEWEQKQKFIHALKSIFEEE